MSTVWQRISLKNPVNETGKGSATARMRIIEILKNRNRILLEMQTGLLIWGTLCQIVGAFFAGNQIRYAVSLWFGILFAMVSTVHMYQTLDRALDFDEGGARKLIFRGYLIRYMVFVVILFIIMITDAMNPLIVFLAYMGLKVTAYLQPITHKFYNKLFHETDPIPEAIPEEANGEGNVSQQ